MVAAMSQASFSERLRRIQPEQAMVFVGDREDIQLYATKAKVLAVVITGGMELSAKVRCGGQRIVESDFCQAGMILRPRYCWLAAQQKSIP